MYKVEDIGYGQIRGSVWNGDILKVITVKRGMGGCGGRILIERFVKNVCYGNTKISSKECELNKSTQAIVHELFYPCS